MAQENKRDVVTQHGATPMNIRVMRDGAKVRIEFPVELRWISLHQADAIRLADHIIAVADPQGILT
jgi:FixJ family two-component response regulator